MRLPLILALLAAPAATQDMIGISWSGQVWSIDSFNAVATPIGGSGSGGHNAMAVDTSCRLWTTERSGTIGAFAHHLAVVDPASGNATRVWSNVPDIRGLTGDEFTAFWGIVEGSSDQLHRIDPRTGALTPAPRTTGMSGIQALEVHEGVLYGWDLTQGLVVIDRATGVAVDVNPSVGGGSIVQFLAVRADGMLIGGRDGLYTIDTTTGATTFIGSLGSNLDLRGAESRAGMTAPFGAGCAGSFGTSSLTVTGTLAPGNTLTTTSDNHQPSSLGVLVLGLSRTTFGATPLPLDLDPLLGTSGCALRVSIDATLPGTTSIPPGPAMLSIPLPLPRTLSCPRLFVQHAALETVPGGSSWTNGVALRLAF